MAHLRDRQPSAVGRTLPYNDSVAPCRAGHVPQRERNFIFGAFFRLTVELAENSAALFLDLQQQAKGLAVVPVLKKISKLVDVGVDQKQVVRLGDSVAGALFGKVFPEGIAAARDGQLPVEIFHEPAGIAGAIDVLEADVAVGLAASALLRHGVLPEGCREEL